MEMVKKDGGVSTVMEKLDLLRNMATEVGNLLDSSIALLDEEEKDDTTLRSLHSDRWNRTPSHTLTSNLRMEGQKHKANLEHAIKSDGYINNMITENKRGIELLCADQGQILQLLPETSRQDVSISTLKQLLKELDKLIFNRETTLNQLREFISKDDIIEKVVKTPDIELELLFSKEIGKYDELIGKIKESLNQTDLLCSIKDENDRFMQKRSANEQLMQRQQVLQEFEVAYNSYSMLKEHVSEGIQFYTSFLEILQKFKTKCTDYVFARKTEKQDILQDFQNRPSSNYIVTTTTSQSPPLPPNSYQMSYRQAEGQPQQQSSHMAYSVQSSQFPQGPPPPYSSSVGMMPVQMVPVMMSHSQSQVQPPIVQFYPLHTQQQLAQQQQQMAQKQQQHTKPSAFPPNPYGL